MADLPLLWQIVVTGLIILGLVYLLTLGISIYFSKESDVHDVTWDGNLEEGSNPAPAWWFWLGISSAIFAIFYMIFYPSFGNYKGLFEMDNAQRYLESKANITHDYYKELEGLEQSDTVTLQFNADAMKLASNIFAQNCAACHNKDGVGQANFPNLTDDDWIWGGELEQITQTITNGRKATMPAWGSVLGKEGVENVAKYVKSVADNVYDEKKHGAGKAKYRQFCIACHGMSLKGNPIFGAPNLGDSVWIYGGDLETIKQSIASGRQGVMPAHKDRLTPLQIKLLAAWLKRNN
ncbi:Cytochrome c oxidase subunit CcoP [Bathymodiolus thermophilus thioautotrophic gill symbiont]|uniref:cytochrome-c oxidase, cbb3-type subunit III n=1 Tax=Bathymodiolus thermophilus thioautotrophic gill symbiont TaxID=2360 RepID=UPI0010B3221B|nr:cytochrome-c oxidase, cbb3-type subunit III [Bathymodiolus thermophilus thioautotrophic gill symbiont]SHA09965.1 Cytochrome c oxidase subunit CcoP [Bathymodiolus thermophilus thioautotrophic gill symbiont]